MSSPDLTPFFQPRGVAVIGASHDPSKLGYGLVHNLIQYGYSGAIYPVNPRGGEILGLPVYRSIAEVPDPLDLAIIIVPAPLVEEQLIACGERGVKAVTVISGGFREVGPEGAAREETLKEIAARYGIHLLGPNCVGTMDPHAALNATFVPAMPAPGEIAFVSQSGAMAAVLIDWAERSGVGFSRIASLGNQAGVSEAEMIAAIPEDGHTRVITAYIEGVADGRAFVETARRVSREVPIVALKAGRGSGGAKAVASHTGALAGSEEAYNAAFRRAGVLRAETLEEMLDWARALAWRPLPRGKRVVVLTNAGGPGVLALDAVELAGLEAAPLTEETKAFLRRRLPPAASVNNPVDILPGSGPGVYAVCLDALLADETVDAVIVLTAPQKWFSPLSLAEVIGNAANGPLGREKPVMAVIMGITPGDEATQALYRERVPNFEFPEQAGDTLAAMWRRRRWLDALEVEDPLPAIECDRLTGQSVIQAALEVMKAGQGTSGGWMEAGQVETLLTAYHIPVPRGGLAPSLDQALPLAETVGYPVALKLAISGVTHKSEVGAVALNINSPEELKAAFGDLMARVKAQMPSVSLIEGIYVQHMVQGQVELIVGVVRDPQFGPLVMVGTGGTQVELLRDVAFELAPLTARQADEMLDRTTAGRLLAGYRGAPPADRKAVVDVILRLAQIALDWPQIAEIEINPLVVMREGEGASAVDVRVRLQAVE